jgi:hypothetical protein
VYVARQTGLGRRVALKVYPARVDGIGAAWPEHAGVARLHAAGAAGGGGFTASQLAAGGSLATRLAAGDLAREHALALCDQVAETLDAIAVAHGALSAGNVLIDAEGRALLCDFGMPGVDASPAADQQALDELRTRCRQLPAHPARRRRRQIALSLATLATAAAIVVAGALGDDDDSASDGVTAPLPGAALLGSRLDGPQPLTLGCDGAAPSGSAPLCTLVQLRRDGRPVRFAADGVVRRWTVRGASGDMALHIARPSARGRYVLAARSQTERVTGPTAQSFATDIAVRRGDLAGIELGPGAGVGVTRDARGAAALRFLGALHFAPPRQPAPPTATGLDGALELRVEYLPGTRPRPVPTLTGGAARDAPTGRLISTGEIELRDGRVRTLDLVALPGSVVLDLLRGRTRLQRIEVAGADPRGRLISFERFSRLAIGPIVMWRNPGGREIVHDYRATGDGLEPID